MYVFSCSLCVLDTFLNLIMIANTQLCISIILGMMKFAYKNDNSCIHNLRVTSYFLEDICMCMLYSLNTFKWWFYTLQVYKSNRKCVAYKRVSYTFTIRFIHL